MLVGRVRELLVVDEAIARALIGERAVLVITGEPGIGKSRLLTELATRATGRGAKVAWGRTAEVGATPAFWPWLQILHALEAEDDRAPSIVSNRADAASRLAAFDQVAAFIVRRAGVQPCVLVLDDVHAADPSSLQLLEYVVPRLADHRVLVALAARDADASPDVQAALGRVQRGARRLPLGRLARADVDALVGDRADQARVFELSAGNPLFVEELVASAEAEGVVRLPPLSSVRAVIHERVGQLPDDTRTVLVAAALVGRELDGRVVADILGRRDIGAALQPALRRGIITMTTPDRFKFSHALVAETLADELDPSERARLHLRAAQALEKQAGDAAEVAHHLLQAGNLAADAAVTAAERAARDAMTRLAFEDAADLLERAARLAAPTDARRRIELACARAEALQHASRHDRAKTILDDIEPRARDLAEPDLLARIAIARGIQWTFGTTDPLLVAALRDALAKLGPDAQLWRARVLARLAAALQPAEDPEIPVAHAREAIVMARALPPRERLDVLYTAAGGMIDYVPPDEMDALNGEVLELARSLGARVVATHTQLRMCFTALDRLDRDAFDASRKAFVAMAEPLGPRWLRHAHMLEALSANLDGNFAEAAEAARRAEAIHLELDDANGRWLLEVHHAMTAAARGELIGTISASLANLGPGWAPIRAWQAAHDGDLDAARLYLAETNPALMKDTNVGAAIALATALAGDRALVEARYADLVPRAGTAVIASVVGCCVQDLTDRLLLLLAAASEQWSVVDEHAERALAVARRLRSAPWIARVRADWARALSGRDPARAKAQWQLALPEADRLGMKRLAEQCRAALGGKPAPEKSREAVCVSREGSLWTITGFDDEVHVRDSRGMQMLARLVGDPGREVHVLDLMGASNTDGGDAGELLDATARARYRERLADLVAERDRAREWGDTGRAERANDEIEALTVELERAVGLGGRDRRAGVAAERARSNVQRRLQHAIQQIRAASRRLGEHFAATVKTGTLCVYAP